MENFDFIESGIIFGLTDRLAFRKFKYTSKDFAQHGDAFKFLTSYYDTYAEVPTPETLCENFPTLNPAAETLNLDYAIDTFQSQVLHRRIIETFQTNKELLLDNPKHALAQINHGLQDIAVVYDEDITYYNQNASSRFTEWQERTEKRKMGDGIMGIPTPFTSLNKMGVGWMPGEMVSLFARPSVGKSWMCVQAAVTAVMNGYKTLLISTEMPTAQMNMRMDVVLGKAMGYNFYHRDLRSGNPIDENAYQEFLDHLDNVPLLVCDHVEGESSISLESIHNLIRKYTPDFVVIDGVYLITSSGRNTKAMWEQTHMLFYGLKNLCLSTNTAMFVSTQATKEASDVYMPPQPDQVAFGDALLRASDVVMSMCLIEEEEERRLLVFQKYRDGIVPGGAVSLDWQVNTGIIGEMEDEF